MRVSTKQHQRQWLQKQVRPTRLSVTCLKNHLGARESTHLNLPFPPLSAMTRRENFMGHQALCMILPYMVISVKQSICDETGHVIPSSTSGSVPTLPFHCFTLHTPLTSTPCSFFHSSNTGEDKSTSSKGTGQEEHDGSATGGFKPSRATRSLHEHCGDRRQPERDHLSERGRVQVSKHTL